MAMLREEGIEKAITEAIANEVRHRVAAAIESAKMEVEREINKSVASIVIAVHKMYSIERYGNDLVIRVKIDGGGAK